MLFEFALPAGEAKEKEVKEQLATVNEGEMREAGFNC